MLCDCVTVQCRREDWASASPLTRGGRSEHKTRRVNLLEEGAYETAPTANGRRIRKPLDNDFLYYAQASHTGRYLLYSVRQVVKSYLTRVISEELFHKGYFTRVRHKGYL